MTTGVNRVELATWPNTSCRCNTCKSFKIANFTRGGGLMLRSRKGWEYGVSDGGNITRSHGETFLTAVSAITSRDWSARERRRRARRSPRDVAQSRPLNHDSHPRDQSKTRERIAFSARQTTTTLVQKTVSRDVTRTKKLTRREERDEKKRYIKPAK